DTSLEDLRAMYQFIRSLGPSDTPSLPALPPGEEPQTLFIRVVPGPKAVGAPPGSAPGQPEASGERKDSADGPNAAILNRGRYILVTGHGNNCHSANYGALEGNVPEKDWLKGSRAGHRGAWGTTYATNLRTNVGLMTEAQWVTYAKAAKPRPPMPWWAVHE